MSYIKEEKIISSYCWQLWEKHKPNQHVKSGYICEPPSNGIIVFKITGACENSIFCALSLFYSANSKMWKLDKDSFLLSPWKVLHFLFLYNLLSLIYFRHLFTPWNKMTVTFFTTHSLTFLRESSLLVSYGKYGRETKIFLHLAKQLELCKMEAGITTELWHDPLDDYRCHNFYFVKSLTPKHSKFNHFSWNIFPTSTEKWTFHVTS